jgi:hypothetical protein
VSKFKYFGTTVINQSYSYEEIKNRLNSRNDCCHSVQNILSSSLLSNNVKIKIDFNFNWEIPSMKPRSLSTNSQNSYCTVILRAQDRSERTAYYKFHKFHELFAKISGHASGDKHLFVLNSGSTRFPHRYQK